MKLKKFVLLLVSLLFSLTACAGIGQSASLDGTSWTLVSMAGDPLVANTHPSIAFEDGQVSGNSSCNSYGGEYTLKGDAIEFGMMMSTEMACLDSGVMDQEQAFMVLLGSVERWELRDGQLYLLQPNGDALVFDPQN